MNKLTKGALSNASEAVKRLNPTLFGVGEFQPEIRKQKAEPALDCKPSGRKKGACGVAAHGPFLRITIIGFQRRIFDSDNFITGCKPLRDAIARWLETDDKDSAIEWNYNQILTKGKCGTAVAIERI